MYTGTAAYDWTELRARGAQAVQRAEAGLPWEPDASRAGNDQEVWLISFVDVLTLLLTLFVLLLAYQRDELTAIAARPQPVTVAVPRAAPMTEQATAPAPMMAMRTGFITRNRSPLECELRLGLPGSMSGHDLGEEAQDRAFLKAERLYDCEKAFDKAAA